MKMLTGLLFLAYAVLLGAKSEGPTLAALPDLLFGLEVALDLLAIAAALQAGQKLVAGAFAATLISTTNFQVLSRVFAVKLPQTMGTWLELEINAPYVSCYALAALALWSWTREDRTKCTASLMLTVLALGLTLGALLPGLGRTGYPMQNRVLHVICFVVSAFVYGFGVVNMAAIATPSRALTALGFVSLAMSGLFFQVTEIFPKAYALDVPMELTWTLGQFAAIAGLMMHEPEKR